MTAVNDVLWRTLLYAPALARLSPRHRQLVTTIAVQGVVDDLCGLSRSSHLTPAHVYFIEGVASALVKIGCASDVHGRLASLQTGSPERLRLIGVVRDGGRELERELHTRFAATRAHGEWFRPTTDLLDYVREVGS